MNPRTHWTTFTGLTLLEFVLFYSKKMKPFARLIFFHTFFDHPDFNRYLKALKN